jgi:lysine 2,3-aminomutase
VASLVDREDLHDPLRLQYVPSRRELNVLPEEREDPIGDDPYTPVKGVTHRYPDRALLKPLHVCPVYCRFCFRREKVGPGSDVLSDRELAEAIAYIRRHDEIWEVILSGGDPMLLSPKRLGQLMSSLSDIDHVKVVRVHTRVPVVDPNRVTRDMVAALKVRATVYVVLHANHTQEFSDAGRRACAMLVDNGIPMLSQTVLLKGVNDTPAALEELMRTLVVNRIKPYYLHHCDLAPGTSHFRTTIGRGQEIMRALRGRVSGVCQPLYVLDIPGGHGKVPIGPSYLTQGPPDEYVVEDYKGARHQYPGTATPASQVEPGRKASDHGRV